MALPTTTTQTKAPCELASVKQAGGSHVAARLHACRWSLAQLLRPARTVVMTRWHGASKIAWSCIELLCSVVSHAILSSVWAGHVNRARGPRQACGWAAATVTRFIGPAHTTRLSENTWRSYFHYTDKRQVTYLAQYPFWSPNSWKHSTIESTPLVWRIRPNVILLHWKVLSNTFTALKF